MVDYFFGGSSFVSTLSLCNNKGCNRTLEDLGRYGPWGKYEFSEKDLKNQNTEFLGGEENEIN